MRTEPATALPTSGAQARQSACRLESLLEQDLGFRNGRRSHPIHRLHSFAARFPPELPRHFIEGLTAPGDLVLDPMAGSGVALVEAQLLGRRVVGVDIDPLATRLCTLKTSRIAPDAVDEAGHEAIETALLFMKIGDPRGVFLQQVDPPTAAFIDYWFRVDTQTELAALTLAIHRAVDRTASVRLALAMLLSSIIITKSGGVSLAMDLAHSRPHKVDSRIPASPIQRFESSLTRMVKTLRNVSDTAGPASKILLADSRELPLKDNSVDLIVTSPPYANALDYMRAHKFALVWLGYLIPQLSRLRGEYIGTEKRLQLDVSMLPRPVTKALAELKARDLKKGEVLERYFTEMTVAFNEMNRVLLPNHTAVIVVGPSTMRGLRIQTHRHLADIARECGFQIVKVTQRTLDRNRRMMPARWGTNSSSGIEQRMHEEFVIGMVKQ